VAASEKGFSPDFPHRNFPEIRVFYMIHYYTAILATLFETAVSTLSNRRFPRHAAARYQIEHRLSQYYCRQ
jgi:hypothetical protein